MPLQHWYRRYVTPPVWTSTTTTTAAYTAIASPTTATSYWSANWNATNWYMYDSIARPEPLRPAGPAIRRQIDDEAARRRKAAAQRAHELLLTILNPSECDEYVQHKRITVVGKSGQVYRVNRGRIGNIEVLNEAGRCTHRLCVHPEDQNIPVEDVLVSQVLHLKHDDHRLARIANVHPGIWMDSERHAA